MNICLKTAREESRAVRCFLEQMESKQIHKKIDNICSEECGQVISSSTQKLETSKVMYPVQPLDYTAVSISLATYYFLFTSVNILFSRQTELCQFLCSCSFSSFTFKQRIQDALNLQKSSKVNMCYLMPLLICSLSTSCLLVGVQNVSHALYNARDSRFSLDTKLLFSSWAFL